MMVKPWALLVLLMLASAGCQGGGGERAGRDVAAREVADSEAASCEAAGHEHAHERAGPGAAVAMTEANAAGEAAEPSDLDRPLADLLAAVCEHEVPQHRCDECRYELGMVKVTPDLFAHGGPLDTLVARVRELPSALELNGEVRTDAARSAWLSPRVPGVVRSVRVDLGDRVAAGQLLFEVASSEFARARADYLEALAAHELAEAAMKREEDLFARRVCAEKDVLEARAAHVAAAARERAAADGLRALGLGGADLVQLRDASEGAPGEALLPVRAPFAGTVLERDLGLGVAAAPGDRLLLLGDVDEVWVVASLYESDLAALAAARAGGGAAGGETAAGDAGWGRAGRGEAGRGAGADLAAEVSVAAWPGRTFAGRLDRLSGTLDEATRTATVRVVVPNRDGLLRPGMFARVRLLLPGAATGLALPQEAVLADEGRLFVFVRATADCFVRRPVTTGRATGGWIEIASGLRDGQAVVARGAFLLKSDVLRAKMGAGCAD